MNTLQTYWTVGKYEKPLRIYKKADGRFATIGSSKESSVFIGESS
jgi:hypothetical protein